jgi:hypothetical protein
MRVRSTDNGEVREIPIAVAASIIGDGQSPRGELGPLLRHALSTVQSFPVSGSVSREGAVTFTF